MPRRTYFLWSAVGAVLWATGVTLLGVFLGGIPFVREHVEAGLLLIVAVSLIPIAVEVLRARLAAAAHRRAQQFDEDAFAARWAQIAARHDLLP